MDFKKLWIEGAVYPAMVLLQHNHVVANTRALQRTETLPAEERAVRTRQRLSELLFLCKTQVPAYSDLPFTDLDIAGSLSTASRPWIPCPSPISWMRLRITSPAWRGRKSSSAAPYSEVNVRFPLP